MINRTDASGEHSKPDNNGFRFLSSMTKQEIGAITQSYADAIDRAWDRSFPGCHCESEGVVIETYEGWDKLPEELESGHD